MPALFQIHLVAVIPTNVSTRLAITIAFISATGATDGIHLVDEKDAGLLCPGTTIGRAEWSVKGWRST